MHLYKTWFGAVVFGFLATQRYLVAKTQQRCSQRIQRTCQASVPDRTCSVEERECQDHAMYVHHSHVEWREYFKVYDLSANRMHRSNQNVQPRLEWIDFHSAAGMDHFVIYDAKNLTSTRQLVEPYTARGIVVSSPQV